MYTLDSTLTYDWGDYCGIPGGIPTDRTQYGTTMTTSNTLSEINARIAACPSGQYVQLAAGTYSLGTVLFGIKSGVTLRGAGAGQTIINPTASPAIATYPHNSETYFRNEDGIAISSGYTKGSTSITLSSAPSAYFVVGRLVQITQDDSPDVWDTGVGVYHRTGFPGSYGMSATRNLRFTSRITGITGNTISFATPIPVGYSASLNPAAYPMRTSPMSLCGVENLTINCGGTIDRAVHFANSDQCWVKDVEIYNFTGATGCIRFYNVHQCEINRCYAHDAADYPIQADGYPYFLYYGCSCCSVVDNVAHRVGPTVVNGSSGNVLLNNYLLNIRRRRVTGEAQPWLTQGIIVNHGPQAAMNLVEGNIAQRFQSDGYHGSASHTTLFRNQIHGVLPDLASPTNRRVVDLTRGSYYHNFVGNVIGDGSWEITQYEYDPGESGPYCAYILGFPGMDSTSMASFTSVPWDSWTKSTSVPDADVAATLLRHGNYDYHGSNTKWDESIESHAIPDSLFYDSKPSYFGSLAWPAIGPDLGTMVNDIPAKARWDRYVISADLDDLFADEA